MGHALIAYLAAAAVAASHAAAPANGMTAALAARPLHGSVVLRASPGGRQIVRVGSRGPLGGPLVFGVVGARGRWVEVTAEALPNGHHGWVEFGRDVRIEPIRWTLRASLSRREVYVRRDGKLMRTIPVGLGAPGSPTPTGRFAIAEKVTGPFGPGVRAAPARVDRTPAASAAGVEHAGHVLRRVSRRHRPGIGGLRGLPSRNGGGRPLSHAHRSPWDCGADLAMIGTR